MERDRDTIIEGVYEDINILEMSVRIVSLMRRRELSMFLLRNMKEQPKEDWDCDILIDIFKMLDYDEPEQV